MSEKYQPAVPPMYGETDEPHGLALLPAPPAPHIKPFDSALLLSLLTGTKKPAAKKPGRPPTVAPMWMELNGTGGITYTLMPNNDAVRLDLIKREGLDTVKPQPAGWLVDGASGTVGALSADQVKTLSGN